MAPRNLVASPAPRSGPAPREPVPASPQPRGAPEPMTQSTSASSKRPVGDNGSYFGKHYADKPLIKRLNWLHVPLLLLTPALAVYGVATTPLYLKTFLAAVGYYFWSALGITAGYHRLFSHRAYKAVRPLRWLLVLMGSGAVQGSVRWWCRDHRAHHRYVDTPKDPYAVTEGFFYAHIGWMLIKQDPKLIGRSKINDLNTEAFIRFQHRQYHWFALIFGFIVPTLICGLGWGDWRGGFFYAAVARLVFVHHSTFFINSLAHYWGHDAFSDKHTAKNSWIAAILTVGEGFHDFHHEFEQDYRNGIQFWDYDPTKWLIRALSFVGLTYDLKRFPRNEIRKGRVQMKQKELNREKATVNWGPDPASLPEYTPEYVRARVTDAKKLWVILDGFVLDLEPFKGEHPGGEGIIRSVLGQDITDKFYGGVYDHSNAATNLATMHRIARVTPAKRD